MSVLGNGRHTAERDSWWSRRSRKGKIGIISLAFLTIAGIAIALFIVHSGLTGSVTVASYEITAHAVHPSNTCDTTIVDNQVNVAWTDVVPEDECALVIDFRGPTTNTGSLKFQQFIVPAGITATLFDAPTCGKLIPNTNTNVTIWIDLKVDETLTDVTFDPNVDGYDFVRNSEAADFNPALCNPVTP